MSKHVHKVVKSGEFHEEKHFYPRTLNAAVHPTVANFLSLSNKRIAERYVHLNPEADEDALMKIFEYEPKLLKWSGADLFPCTTVRGKRAMVVVETNSCPSGQKSMPTLADTAEYGSYETYVKNLFMPLLDTCKVKEGKLAVIFDKNEMEASGYAATIASLTGENCYLVEYHGTDEDPRVRFVEGVMEVQEPSDVSVWVPIRACVRYVTQKPWTCIPLNTKTVILNPVVACLAGGRNKMISAKAYELLNSELDGTGLKILAPQTIRDVSMAEIPMWVASLGGKAVIKVPYANAGQGVYTITNEAEMKDFMTEMTNHAKFNYDSFIVQALVGNHKWSSQYYHIGTVPNKSLETFVADLRLMILGSSEGMRPMAMYSRRARIPLAQDLEDSQTSWDMLGTNLSVKNEDGSWATETHRLLLVDRKDFNRLGLGLDDLIMAYVQTCLSTVAIDKLAVRLSPEDSGLASGLFDIGVFRALNGDESLIEEILSCSKRANVITKSPLELDEDRDEVEVMKHMLGLEEDLETFVVETEEA